MSSRKQRNRREYSDELVGQVLATKVWKGLDNIIKSIFQCCMNIVQYNAD